MHNAIDLLNVCIAPTRLCNLRCDHCYVAPELLSDKSMMAEEVYRATFDRIEELFHADQKVSKINIELLGGELTMMPLAFWERNLPWTLERMALWDSLYDADGALIWCSNLIFKDEGYIDLLNRMGREYGPRLDLFAPWEPDTNRFKKDFKLLPRYLKTLGAITGIRNKTLCITMSKAVIEQGPQFIVDTFLPHGITDVTCDMLYPAGSGKAYFSRTCTYGEVSDFIIGLRKLLPPEVGLSPLVEMESACRTLTHYHYPGNDSYDLEVEPNGDVTFNSSYTGEESIFPSKPLAVESANFAHKVIFNNTPELRLRHSMPYPECAECEFAVACSGGWAWHKQLSPAMAQLISAGDCAGLKKVWQYAKTQAGVLQADRSDYMRRQGLRRRRGAVAAKKLAREVLVGQDTLIVEAAWQGDYEGFFELFERPRLVELASGSLFGKNWAERLFFYDAIGCQILTDEAWYQKATAEGGEELFRHIAYRNYHALSFDDELVVCEILRRPDWALCRKLVQIVCAIQAGEVSPGSGRHDELYELAFSVADSQLVQQAAANAA